MTIRIGAEAPDFTLRDQANRSTTLSEYRGTRNVLLVFFPFAFSGMCTGELCGVRDDIGTYQNDALQVLGISTDQPFALRAFAEKEGYDFPLLSDFWPHGEVARSYGVFDDASGLALRGTFIVDKQGTVAYKVVNAIPDARDLEEYRSVLARI